MSLPTLTPKEGRTKLEIQMADLKDLTACCNAPAWREASLLIVRMAQTAGAVCRGFEAEKTAPLNLVDLEANDLRKAI